MYLRRHKSSICVLLLQILDYLLISYLPLVIGLLPLLAAFVVGLDRKQQLGHWLATCFLALAMFLGGYLCVLAYHDATWHSVFTWSRIPSSATPFSLILSFRVDFSTAVMVLLTTTLNFIIHLYALAYMREEFRHYMVLTGSFVSTMIGFLAADDFVTCFIGWEIMGWISYLLINFWYQREVAASNGTKVWFIGQLGTMTSLVGILIIGSELGSFDLSTLTRLPWEVYLHNSWLVAAQCCLVGGILIKLAQFPWLNWLSSAMNAPTPASALIHTATMVGAGVYLLVRLGPILAPAMRTGLAYWGGLMAFMGACYAVKQQHMKQVLAYSTISQLGYIVMAVGVRASSVGLFHFVTHAFGKACLFLCVGAVSRFMHQHDESNAMQHMGGLRRVLPSTFYIYVTASLSLVGVPTLAGALSKEAIFAHTLAWANQQAQQGNYFVYLVPLLGFCATFLTVVYVGRQCCLVFMGTPRWAHRPPTSYATYHTPWLMKISIFVLAMGTLGFWYGPSGYAKNGWLLHRLEQIPHLASTLPITDTLQHQVALASNATLFLGFIFLIIWATRSPAALLLPRTKLFLGEKAWDQLNNATAQGVLYLSRLVAQFDSWVVNDWMRAIGRGYLMVGNISSWLDRKLIESVILLIAPISRYLNKAHQATQRGSLQNSLLWMFIGIGLLLGGVYWATHDM